MTTMLSLDDERARRAREPAGDGARRLRRTPAGPPPRAGSRPTGALRHRAVGRPRRADRRWPRSDCRRRPAASAGSPSSPRSARSWAARCCPCRSCPRPCSPARSWPTPASRAGRASRGWPPARWRPGAWRPPTASGTRAGRGQGGRRRGDACTVDGVVPFVARRRRRGAARRRRPDAGRRRPVPRGDAPAPGWTPSRSRRSTCRAARPSSRSTDAPATRLTHGGHADAAVRPALDVAAVALAAEQLGGAQACLEMTVGYVKERRQFGRPIGSFQAVKHTCADLLVLVEACRSAVVRAVDAEGSPDALAEAAARRADLVLRRLPHRHGRDRAAARRHRLHLGARRPPVLPAGPRRRRPARRRAAPPRAARQPARLVAPLGLERPAVQPDALLRALSRGRAATRGRPCRPAAPAAGRGPARP